MPKPKAAIPTAKAKTPATQHAGKSKLSAAAAARIRAKADRILGA